MPKSKHRRKGRNRPRRTQPQQGHHGDHPDCEVCQALAGGDQEGAIDAMFTPPTDDERHRVLDLGGEAMVLLAHGEEQWEMPPEEFTAGRAPCPVCGLELGGGADR